MLITVGNVDYLLVTEIYTDGKGVSICNIEFRVWSLEFGENVSRNIHTSITIKIKRWRNVDKYR